MSFRTIFILIITGFCLLCGWLVMESGFPAVVHSSAGRGARSAQAPPRRPGFTLLQQTTETDVPTASEAEASEPPDSQLQAAAGEDFSAVGGRNEQITLGSVDPASGFMYQVVLDSQGAAIRTATFSEFDERGYKDPDPLVFLAPVQFADGQEALSMASRDLALVSQGRRLSLDRLAWKALDVETTGDGAVAASFEALVVNSREEPAFRLTKTYRVRPGTYLLESTFVVENLTSEQQEIWSSLSGPVGLGREGFRSDMRKAVAGFRDPEGRIASIRLDMKALGKAGTPEQRDLKPKNPGSTFLWAAAVNKYFSAIVVPTPEEGQASATWLATKRGVRYDPGGLDGQDATVGLALSTAPTTLGPAGQADSARTYQFQVYLGPKDKSLFDKNELYRTLGFVETIDFLGCCCPASIIYPLAFGILAIMKWMYGFIHNYGIVIMILVFLMRLILHPVTKKSQVAMSRMTKLAPRTEEIKKKYAGNKTEMNKHLMELYREQGASPVMGFLPMMVQMPIWIALWSAIYTSIDLRGAPFLPFWITDLSIPDALIRFPTIHIPLVNWPIESLNLLPILMGAAFYLQQKLMPTQASAATNPQMAQQQKMMTIMMPLLFPLMLYRAPSGVNLYIMTSTFTGVIEQYVIRKHIRQKDEQEAKGVVSATSKTGGKVKKKKPKPFYRI
jgi:YidC/Oxa1 family membrane protein insertase